MLGLFKRKQNLSQLEQAYEKTEEKLMSLLEIDIGLIEKQKKELETALNTLKSTKRLTQANLNVIKSRLEFIHNNLILADKQSGEEAAHMAAKATTLDQLKEEAEDIFNRIVEKKIL